MLQLQLRGAFTAGCPGRMTGTGSGMLLPALDDTRRLSTELAARL